MARTEKEIQYEIMKKFDIIFGNNQSEYDRTDREKKEATEAQYKKQREAYYSRPCPNKENHEAYDEYKRLLDERKIEASEIKKKICLIYDIQEWELMEHSKCREATPIPNNIDWKNIDIKMNGNTLDIKPINDFDKFYRENMGYWDLNFPPTTD